MIAWIKKFKRWFIGLFVATAFAGGAEQLNTIPQSLETKDTAGCGAPIGQEFDVTTKKFTMFFAGCDKSFSLTKEEFNSVNTLIVRKTKKEIVEQYIKDQYGYSFDIELDKNGEPSNVAVQWQLYGK